MPHADFVHLRVHSAYSLSEGALRVKDIVSLCQRHQMPAVGITDTNNLFGALEFSEKLSKAGTQPIIGTQILFKYKEFEGLIPLIAKNNDGYKNIIKLSSK